MHDQDVVNTLNGRDDDGARGLDLTGLIGHVDAIRRRSRRDRAQSPCLSGDEQGLNIAQWLTVMALVHARPLAV